MRCQLENGLRDRQHESPAGRGLTCSALISALIRAYMFNGPETDRESDTAVNQPASVVWGNPPNAWVA